MKYFVLDVKFASISSGSGKLTVFHIFAQLVPEFKNVPPSLILV